MTTDGGASIFVTYSEVRISGDGAKVVYARYTHASTVFALDWFVANAENGATPQPIAAPTLLQTDYVAVDAIGSRLGVIWPQSGSFLFGVQDINGTARDLLSNTPHGGSIDLSGDGNTLAFSSPVSVIATDGTTPVRTLDPEIATDAVSTNHDGSLAVVAFVSNGDLQPGMNSDLGYELFSALLRPSLSVDGAPVSSHPQQQSFAFTGFGFMPNQIVTRRVRQPNGVEVTLLP